VTDENATAAPPSTTKPRNYPDLGRVGTVVDKRIHEWQNELHHKNPAKQAHGVAVLARLRRGVGKPPGSVADILGFTLADEFAGRWAGDGPTEAESAAHIAMTLYAVHQQSQAGRMHQRGRGLGRAVRRLHPAEPGIPPAPVVRRFQALVTAQSLDELVHHARGMVQLLRAEKPAGLPLDYGLLADQLVLWQKPDGPPIVQMRWARDFYRTPQATAASDADAATDSATSTDSIAASASISEGN
jgi:CRISPR system Cascade subunit CasB